MASNFDRCQAPPGFAELVGSKAELRGPRGKEHVRTHKSWRKPPAVMVRHSGKFFLVEPGSSCDPGWAGVCSRGSLCLFQ